ncbi:hypothetical protein GCM10010187_43850 [Actinomadura coerulea]|nr:hypothetical protein GCM10010187_43850 [Actinomadura coerulea]
MRLVAAVITPMALFTPCGVYPEGTWSTVAATKVHASAASRTRALRALVDFVVDMVVLTFG